MTTRVYLAAARFLNESALPDDMPVERVFVNASEVSEIWVETESRHIPAVGRVGQFALARTLDLGFIRVVGTIERTVKK